MNPFSVLFLLCPTLLLAQHFSGMQYRNVGPYRGGRVTTVAGLAKEPGTFYLGATGGGVWKTKDYGTTWTNISDGFFETPSIGSIAVAENDPNILYVGTGSDGLRSNIIEGKGIYKSIDGGNTWFHVGLKDAGQIGAVRIHPYNNNIVYVAAIGRAFQSNDERGVYKTSDGGKTWNQVLKVSSETGFYDIEMLPNNPEVLYATAWKARRTPWTIESGGKIDEGGIYKSVDAGLQWQKISGGLPSKLIGKVDVAVTPADSKIVYALVEAPGEEGGLYRSEDQGLTFELVSNDKRIRTRPFYYTNVSVDPQNPDVVYVMATGYFKSVDGGQSWTRMTPPHGDNHDMWINPDNPDLFIQANDGGANITHNGGETWSTQFNQPTSEIYQVEVDDQYPYWLYGGMQDNYTTVAVPSQAPYGLQASGIGHIINTGGCETGPAVPKPGNPNVVYANCKGRFSVFNKLTGTEKSYYVGASNMYGHNPRDLKFRFQRVSPIHISPHDSQVIYHCSQYVHRTTDEGQTWETISPDLTAFESDKQVISGAPITRDITGEEFYSTIYSIRESPIQQGVIWTGANDGPIYVTRDGGKNWKNVTPKSLPPGGRVDAVEPSSHQAGKAYASILRYQLGDRRPFLYKTEDFGESWQLLTDGKNGLPNDFPTRVLREDPVKEGLLYAGTEYGVFVSLDDGRTWKTFQQNLPVVPITDMKVTQGDLVLSTMGRGFWIAENIGTLRQLTPETSQEITLFAPKPTIRSRQPSGANNSQMPKYPRPHATIDYFLPEPVDGLLKLEVIHKGKVISTYLKDTSEQVSQVIRDMRTNNVEFLVDKGLTSKQGMNRFEWDMSYAGPWHKEEKRRYKNGPLTVPDTYTIRLTVEDKTFDQSLTLLIDPREEMVGTSIADMQQQVDLQLAIRDLLTAARRLEIKWSDEIKSLQSEESNTEQSKSRLNDLKVKLNKLATEKGTYRQPMLIDQISYLYFMLNRADQVPGKDALTRFQELKNAFSEMQDL